MINIVVGVVLDVVVNVGVDVVMDIEVEIVFDFLVNVGEDIVMDIEVKEVVENLLDQIVEHQQQSKEPPRKIILRNDCKAEKEWKREVGNVLF